MRLLARLAPLAVMLALFVPAASPAAVRTLSGQVVGATYPSGTRVVVPFLLDARSAKRARVRTPVVRLLVPRAWRVRVPGNRTIGLTHLRAGDVTRLRITKPRRANRSVYPSLIPRVRSLAVTRRGTELSAAELQEQLAALYGYVGTLTSYVLAQFADLRGQVATLNRELAGLRSALAALEAKVAQVEGGVDTQITTLIERVTTLETQIQTLTTQLTQLTSDLTTVQNLLAGVAPGDLAGALSDIAALQAAVDAIDVGALDAELTALAAKVGNVGATDLQTQVDQANAALAAAQAQLSFLCSAGLVKVNGVLPSLALVGACPA